MNTYPGLIIGTKSIQASNVNGEHWRKVNVHGTTWRNGRAIKLPETGINLWLNDNAELWADAEAIMPLHGSLRTFYRRSKKREAIKLERYRNPARDTRQSRVEHYELNSVLDLIERKDNA